MLNTNQYSMKYHNIRLVLKDQKLFYGSWEAMNQKKIPLKINFDV